MNLTDQQIQMVQDQSLLKELCRRIGLQDLIKQAVLDAMQTTERASDTQADSGNNSGTEKPVNVKELCAFLDVTEPTLTRWRKKGKIPFMRLGGRILFDKADVLSALKNKSK